MSVCSVVNKYVHRIVPLAIEDMTSSVHWQNFTSEIWKINKECVDHGVILFACGCYNVINSDGMFVTKKLYFLPTHLQGYTPITEV